MRELAKEASHDRLAVNNRPELSTYQMLCLDLDGTFLDSDSRIRDEDREAVLEASRGGVRVVLTSGRMLPSVEAVAEDLELEEPMVAYNGGKVFDRRSRTCLLHAALGASAAAEIVAEAEDRGIHVNYYLDDVLYVKEMTAWGDLYRSRTGSTVEPVGSLRQFAGAEPTKLILIMAPEDVERELPIYRERYGNQFYVTVTNPEYLEFMNKEVSKATGAAIAAEFLGISPSSALAIGDAPNDVCLLEWAGLGVAMGNAPDAVRDRADVIAPGNDEGGVAWAVREFLLAPRSA